MAIEKQINIVVKETGLDQVQKQVNKLDVSLENLSDTNKGVTKSMGESFGAVLDNGGAMGLLNDATGGLAMTVKDAVEASVLFTKSQKLSAMWQGVYTTVVGTSTGALKAFRIALALTGIGAVVIAIGLLIANFDKVKKVVLNLVPGLALVGDFINGIVESITDFIGVTYEAERALAELTAQADKSLAMNKKFMSEQGDILNEYTKQKIEAKNKYLEAVKEEGADQKALASRLNRELLAIDKKHNDDLEKTRKDKQDKLDEANKVAAEKAKQARLKADEEAKKALDEKIKSDAQKTFELNEEQKQVVEDITKFRNDEIEKREDVEIESGINAMARIQGEYDAEKKASDDKIFLDNEVKNAKIDIANQTLNLISEIAGKGSKVAKAIAIAQATASGVQGVQNAFTTASASPITTLFPTYPFIQAGLAGAFSALQIAKIAKGEKAGGGSSGVGSGGGSTPSAPSFNLVQGTNSNQIAQSINTQQPIEAFVVSKNVSTGQELDRNIIKSASL